SAGAAAGNAGTIRRGRVRSQHHAGGFGAHEGIAAGRRRAEFKNKNAGGKPMTIAIDKAGAAPAATNAAERAADKAMLHLLPWLLLMYIFAYLDRAKLGFAKNAFQASTGISEAAYAFGAGIFSIAYASIEIPSNIMLRRVGARLWLSRIMVTWGIVSASMMFVNGATSFYIVRVLL